MMLLVARRNRHPGAHGLGRGPQVVDVPAPFSGAEQVPPEARGQAARPARTANVEIEPATQLQAPTPADFDRRARLATQAQEVGSGQCGERVGDAPEETK